MTNKEIIFNEATGFRIVPEGENLSIRDRVKFREDFATTLLSKLHLEEGLVIAEGEILCIGVMDRLKGALSFNINKSGTIKFIEDKEE